MHTARTWYVCDAPLCLFFFSFLHVDIKYYLTKVVIWRSLLHTSFSQIRNDEVNTTNIQYTHNAHNACVFIFM